MKFLNTSYNFLDVIEGWRGCSFDVLDSLLFGYRERIPNFYLVNEEEGFRTSSCMVSEEEGIGTLSSVERFNKS